MNDTQLLERLASAYETLDAPPASSALAELLDAGGATVDDGTRDAVVIPLSTPRPRMRMRYLVAAMVASFVALSGLAAAGALPDSIQHQVSSVVSHLGIDLPNPQPAHDGGAPGPVRNPPGGVATTAPSASTTTPAAGATPTGSANGTPATGPAATPTTTPPGGVLGDVGALGGDAGVPTDTTLPAGDGGGVLPPISLPPIQLPPIGIPGLPLPPISLPPISLPPIDLHLPLLGL
jgi:hypothetical protein